MAPDGGHGGPADRLVEILGRADAMPEEERKIVLGFDFVVFRQIQCLAKGAGQIAAAQGIAKILANIRRLSRKGAVRGAGKPGAHD